MGKLKNILKTNIKDDDIDKKKPKIKNVRFKATVKAKEAESTFTKLNNKKPTVQLDSQKLNDIKKDLVKNVNENKLVKVKKVKKEETPKVEKIDKIAKLENELKSGKIKKKKDKIKIKKLIWKEKISKIKSNIKDKVDRKKRENTVITGDMKPLNDTLFEMVDKIETKSKQKPQEPKEKSIAKQSKRNKQSQEDISLFSQISELPQFTNNPIENLKKIFKK